MPHVTNIQQI